MEDHRRHFEALLPAFCDKRYLKVDGKPLFAIYNPMELPDTPRVLELWRVLAEKAGLPGLYFVAERWLPFWYWDPKPQGYDAAVKVSLKPLRDNNVSWNQPAKKIKGMYHQWRGRPTVYPYEHFIDNLTTEKMEGIENFPCVIPNWDNTPRSGKNGLVLHESTPELFRLHLRRAIDGVRDIPPERRIVFVKSWNEWAEGNHLEPDLRHGHRYLEVLREELLIP
jgi:hypothetical protein